MYRCCIDVLFYYFRVLFTFERNRIEYILNLIRTIWGLKLGNMKWEKEFIGRVLEENLTTASRIFSLVIWIIGILLHVVIVTNAFTTGFINESSKLVLFSFIIFTYTLFRYSKGFCRAIVKTYFAG
jgi:hypothetical protein